VGFDVVAGPPSGHEPDHGDLDRRFGVFGLALVITADIYSHLAPAQLREAADRLDAALDG